MEPIHPTGMLLAPQKTKNNVEKTEVGDIIVVAGWEKLSNGRLGPVQTSGAVRLGDRLIQVNRIQIITLKFQDVMGMLRSLRENGSLRSLTFVSSKHLQKKQSGVDGGVVGNTGISGNEERSVISKSLATQSSLRRKYTFSSFITGFRINTGTPKTQNDTKISGSSLSEGSNNAGEKDKGNDKDRSGPFVEYKIVCNLLTRGYGGEMTETTQSWTLWKRFSQFQDLYEKLIHVYGWQLTNVETNSQTPFPSKKPFSSSFLFLNAKLRESFCESRREELDKFWRSMLKIEEITDFAQPHRYSRDLASFLSIEEYLYPPASSTRNMVADDSISSGDGGSRDANAIQPPFYFPSEIQNEDVLKNSSNNRTVASRQKNTSYNLSTNRSKKEQYKNRIPAKSSFQRHSPGLVGSSPLVFRKAMFA